MSQFFSREELLGGLPARRASTLLYAIEGRTAQLAALSQRAATPFLSEKSAVEQERGFLDALSQGRDLAKPPTIQQIELYAPQWAKLIPADPGVRAVVIRQLGEKYQFTRGDVPSLRRTLGMDDPAIAAEYEWRHGQPLVQIYATKMNAQDRLRWLWARLSGWLENLPPFWTVFALTLTETVGAGTLALPIAMAQVGPLGGVIVLVVLGIVNVITIVALTEAATRSGRVRYGQAYFTGLIGDFLGPAAALVVAPSLFAILRLILVAYYVGLGTTLAKTIGLPAQVFVALLFGVNLFFVFRRSLNATIASALLIGAINIGLLVVLSGLGVAHLRPEYLQTINLPFVGGRPFDPGVVGLIFGVVLGAYCGHFSTATAARLVLARDPGGRSLLWGNFAAMTAAMLLYALFVLAVNGSVPASTLKGMAGTAITPLADVAGPVVSVLGSIFAILAMGMASIHMAIALFN